MTTRVLLVAWLTLLWLVLWRDVSPANVVSGVVVAMVVTTVFAMPRSDHRGNRARPVAMLRFLLYFAWKLVEANVILAREVLTVRDSTRPGIIGVPLRPASNLVITAIATVVSLTPGTLTLWVSADPRVLYIHVLHLHDPDRTRREIHRLEALARRAHGYDREPAPAAPEGASPT